RTEVARVGRRRAVSLNPELVGGEGPFADAVPGERDEPLDDLVPRAARMLDDDDRASPIDALRDHDDPVAGEQRRRHRWALDSDARGPVPEEGPSRDREERPQP